MGTPDFSVPILDGLIEEGYEVLAVVTQPDRPVGRKRKLTPPPVKVAAEKHGLLVLQPEKLKDSKELQQLMSLTPDLIVTAAFGQFLPSCLLALPKKGAINVHASLLPKYRGGAPVHYAVMNGDKETGVTIMEMVQKMDAGDILSQRAIPIKPEDNVGTMFEQLSLLGKELLLEMLPDYLQGKITPKPQEESLVSFSPNISREQEKIDWHQSATDIHNQIRGLYPWPVAYTTYQEVRWKLIGSEVSEEVTTEQPGTLIEVGKKELKVACGEGTVLSLIKIKPAGKGELAIHEFLNGVGRTLEVGEKLN